MTELEVYDSTTKYFEKINLWHNICWNLSQNLERYLTNAFKLNLTRQGFILQIQHIHLQFLNTIMT